ncbi:zeta-carotene-forming phytoene desaturase [Neolewinella maritima]|uniref:Zeta-carotene-forming phytoene desaturase n=1 Tax=Neolewinella maritima TaxID=1383882 RepID=A0ABM9B2L2_9BACT|nr:oleate hydratase [Neolewinella maritima]CAH1001443.1 zeta-carotene-forming phytoene desaturase [Neolewinella maritima]
MNKQVIIVGAGFAGLSAAAYLARDGYRVRILEKNEGLGGRARQFSAEGYTFDMGPSWYWMPEVFEHFFNDFGSTAAEHYELVRLDPSYEVVFGVEDRIEVPASTKELFALFEKLEPGSSANLRKFLEEAEYKYRVGIDEFVQKPGHSIMDFADLRVFKSVFKLQMLTDMATYVRRLFKHPQLIQLLEFPVLFLGATPANTPALYSLMNYADLKLGTWYPLGGMHKIIEGMAAVARGQGVEIISGSAVREVVTVKGEVQSVVTEDGTTYPTDVLVCAADYHHFDQQVLAPTDRMYSPDYWAGRTMAPSSLLFYIGLDRRVPGLHHHTLFFDADFDRHAHDIYEQPVWPEDPLFYVCAPSVTDPTVAPDGCENMFFLLPLAPDLDDTPERREHYWHLMCERLSQRIGFDIRPHVVYRRDYAHREFKEDYNAYRGNAYGLANTLLQTAFLKPKLRSKKLRNLWYAGQLTTPGPGMPPSIISGQVAARDIKAAMPVHA